MNDLRNGIIDINGFLLTPTTTLEELENHFGIQGEVDDCFSEFNLGGQLFINNGMQFKLEIVYDNEAPNKVWYVKLTPVIPELIKKYDVSEHNCPRDYYNDLLPYYRDVRAVLDKWLYEQLGEPHENDDHGVGYKFNNILIFTSAYHNKRNPHDNFDIIGGSLEIHYR